MNGKVAAPHGGATRLVDYTPPSFYADEIDLHFNLDADETVVRAKVSYRRNPLRPAQDLILDGSDLQLLGLKLNGTPLPADRYTASPDRLLVHNAPDAFELLTEVAIRPASNSSKKGLFFHEGRLISHCEPEGFRAITYFQDRPDVLTTYTVTLEADPVRFPVLLSNGNCVSEGIRGLRQWRRFHDPYPKPTYIFAVMAGAFERRSRPYVTQSGRRIDLEVYADAADIEKTDFALDALSAALAWDEQAFGLEFDLDTYRIVSLPAYAGAQENKGINLFGSDLVIADPFLTTDEEFELMRRVIGHEVFHNWTGNRVTCRDWFQLGLKEGLTRLRDQLFTEQTIDPGVYRIDQVRTLRRNQFPEDDGPAAHPVQPQSYVKIENFYTNTVYEKGAEVIRMLRTLLGEVKFRDAINLYLTRHDGEAVTLEELVVAAETVGKVDLRQFRRWFRRPGRPRVEADFRFDAQRGTFLLSLTQSPASTDEEALHIPVLVALFASDGRRLTEDVLCELTSSQHTFEFTDISEPPTPSLLRGFSAPITMTAALDEVSLANLVRHDDDPFVAWDSLQNLMIAEVRRLAASWRRGLTLELSERLDHLVGEILAQHRSPRLKALLLAVPDEPVLSEGLARIDLDAHMEARSFVRAALARSHLTELRSTYEELGGLNPGDLSREAVSRRMLRCAALDLLLAAQEPDDIQKAFEQVRDGPSMTESFEALCALSHLDTPLRGFAFDLFYERHQDQQLAVDKWFKAMALSRAPSAIDDIVALAGHPALDLKNTARTLAFFGSFFRQNRWTFHHPSGRGYQFLADRLLAADQMGAGRPSYIMAQIDQWRRYDEHRRELMTTALRRVLHTPGISPGLDEVVRRALGEAVAPCSSV